MNPTNHTLRELFWDNPMTLEATRSIRRFFRAGMNGEGKITSNALNKFMLAALILLYAFTIVGLVSTKEDLSQIILIFEAALLTLLIPGSLYGAIAVEREKQTYDALIMTRLTPAQIICGKFWWRVGLILGVMALFTPLLIITHFMEHHGYGMTEMTVLQVVWAQIGIFTWSLLCGALSLWVSARSKKGITALLVSFGLLALFLLGIPALTALIASTMSSLVYNNSPGMYVCGFLIAANPFFQLATLGVSHSTFNTEYWLNFWVGYDMRFWSVLIYGACTLGLLSGAVKTLRGLEMPAIDAMQRKARRGKLGK